MKVAIITDGVWPNMVGGMQKHSYYLIKHLSALGHRLTVYYPQTEPKIDVKQPFQSEINLQIIEFISVKRSKKLKFPGNYLLHLFQYSKNISEIIKGEEFDLIYIQGLCGWKFLTDNRSTKGVRVLNLHGLNMLQPHFGLKDFIEKKIYRAIALQMIRHADYVQSLGGRLSNILIANNVPKEKILELGIGISKSWLAEKRQINELSRTFTFIGRFDKVKGISELYSAFNRLIEEDQKFILHIIGPFPHQGRIVHEKVIYHGEIKDESQIKRILDFSDFLILTSYSEGMPTVILEAMARFCAIISTDVGAVSELVSQENGMVIAPNSVDEIYEAVCKGLTISNNKLEKMQFVSRKKVEERFVWDNLIKRMETIFENIILK